MKMKRTFTRMAAAVTAVFLFAAMILTGGSGIMTSASAENGTPVYSSSDLFTDRDLKQTADLDKAVTLTAEDGKEIRITEAGTYVLTGTASNATVYVEAGDDDKVQLVLQDLHITNSDFPCIYVYNADKVFITIAADSSLTVHGTFRPDGRPWPACLAGRKQAGCTGSCWHCGFSARSAFSLQRGSVRPRLCMPWNHLSF